ncbi:hypothetical protein D3C72_1250880 [compost metagenome]
MVRMFVLSASVLLGSMTAAQAQNVEGATVVRCVYPNQIERVGYGVLPESRYFQASRGRVYRLDTQHACFERFTRVLRVEPHVATSARMCPGDQVRVTMSVSGVPRACLARLSGPIRDTAEIMSARSGLTR